MKNRILAFSIFISSSALLFAQMDDAAVSPVPVYVSPTDREASAKARILARRMLLEICIENYPEIQMRIHRKANKKGKKAFNRVSVYDYELYDYVSGGVYGQAIKSQGRRYYIINKSECQAAYRQAYNAEYDRLCEEYGVVDCVAHPYNTAEDSDKSIDILKKRNIDPGHISYFYSNQAMITNGKEIEHYLKNITANNHHSNPLKKYIKNSVSRIYLVVYQWDKGSHAKAFLFTPKGVVFERLYFTNIRNVVNPRTGTTIYVTEEEALIFTEG